MTTLAERVRYLIDQYYAGSVNAAAKASGCLQRSLARIAAGEVLSPGSAGLMKLAAHFNTTIDWLVTGCGESPVITPELRRRGELRQMTHAQLVELIMHMETAPGGQECMPAWYDGHHLHWDATATPCS